MSDIKEKVEECLRQAEEIERAGVIKDRLNTTFRENLRYEFLKFLVYLSDGDGYVDEKEIIRPQDMIVKGVASKSGNKIFIIQSIDRKMDFEDIARTKDLDFDELLTEIEGIVNSGTKLDISYYIEQVIDEDKSNDIYLYFKEDAQSDSLDEAIEELGGDYTESAYQ